MSTEKINSTISEQDNAQCCINLGYDEKLIKEYECGVQQAGFKGGATQKLIFTNKRIAVQTSSCSNKEVSNFYSDIPIKCVKGINIRHGVSMTSKVMNIILLIISIMLSIYTLSEEMFISFLACCGLVIWQIVLFVKISSRVKSAALYIEFLTDAPFTSSLTLSVAGNMKKSRLFGKYRGNNIESALGVAVNAAVAEQMIKEVGAIIQNCIDGYYDDSL